MVEEALRPCCARGNPRNRPSRRQQVDGGLLGAGEENPCALRASAEVIQVANPGARSESGAKIFLPFFYPTSEDHRGIDRARRPHRRRGNARRPTSRTSSEPNTMAAIASSSVSARLSAPVAARAASRSARRAPIGGGVPVPAARPVALRRTARGGAARAFAGEEQLASIDAMPVVPELALAGYDTSNLDTLFVNVASFILPAWGIIVGTIFIFGTIAKVLFPEKYDAAVYDDKAKELVDADEIDLDNLSAEDLAAVAALEAERAAGKK